MSANSPAEYITLPWKRLRVAGIEPHPRWGHSSVQLQNSSIIFFGGYNKSYLSDMLLLQEEESKESIFSFQEIIPSSGRPPAPRSNHSASVIGHLLVLFGGGGGNKRDYAAFEQVAVFDLAHKMWMVPIISGVAPKSRSYHSAITFNNSIVVFGGQESVRDQTIDLNDLHIG
eukprot:TRINITY_DN42385_c0_g1_i1.p1 TRINITY_DN42385_c0_g1~~TRINITY_DN42385_c0_g1_i1.p1  ORF type:complete len:186 (-),score=27.30 TRINITY_DN42385_c0_g1_i1:5-520(-)